MTKYLPLETSKKLVELIGDFRTQAFYDRAGLSYSADRLFSVAPAPDFGELVLLFPRIIEKCSKTNPLKIVKAYIDSGGDMEAVAKVLEEIFG